jgi:K+-transporting ATPase ATPase C chain
MITIRLTLMCVVAIGFIYLPAILGFASAVVPDQAAASMINGTDGLPVGSRLVAQAFTSDRYFHPRPSACDYNGKGAAGSNLSPTNPALAERAAAIVKSYAATRENPIPADLVTASGSGLDPDITYAGARYQAPRVASARKLPVGQVFATIDRVKRSLTGKPGGQELVNVLELNLALDAPIR